MNPFKIIVCDDDQGILDVLELMLESEGFEVITEIDSVKLISKIKEYSPHLLLLDLWMPTITGDQILRQIRNDEKMKHLPVIVLSASVHGDDIASDAGANAFVPKPFDMNDLIGKINFYLTNHSALTETI